MAFVVVFAVIIVSLAVKSPPYIELIIRVTGSPVAESDSYAFRTYAFFVPVGLVIYCLSKLDAVIILLA